MCAATGNVITRVPGGSGPPENFMTITPPAACGGGLGLVVGVCQLSSGWIVAGSVYAPGGDAAAAGAGTSCILLLDPTNPADPVARVITDARLSGVWATACAPNPQGGDYVFASAGWPSNGTAPQPNVVYQSGSVLRIALAGGAAPGAGPAPAVADLQYVGAPNSFASMPNPGFLVGPTGLLVTGHNLYVADTLGNAIWAAYGAGSAPNAAALQFQKLCGAGAGGACPGLNNPLGLCIVPTGPWTGNMLVMNGGDSAMVELTSGYMKQAAALTVNTGGMGTLFGCAVQHNAHTVYFANDAGDGGNGELDVLVPAGAGAQGGRKLL